MRSMADDPPYHLDIEGLASEETPGESPGDPAAGERRWIGIVFECCQVYARVYRAPSATSYQGRCPKCLREVRLQVGPGGTDLRFFSAR